MTRLAITGATGLIGWHLHAVANSAIGWDVVPIPREVLGSPADLAAALKDVDAVAHIAGANRGPDDEVAAENVALAERLVAALWRLDAAPALVFANSTKAPGPSAYGQSKAAASDALRTWADAVGASFADFVLPHVFGEGGRPFHNSVVSTFCHQLARGEEPTVVVDAELELLHAQDVVDGLVSALEAGTNEVVRLEGRRLTVRQLLARLRVLADEYESNELPELGSAFEVALFNTYRSYLFPDAYPRLLTRATDNRGSLVECVRSHGRGQTFMSTTHPGVTRGNHFHRRKVERFLVLEGAATIELRRLAHGERVVFSVSGDAPAVVDIPTLHTHNITNVGRTELTTLFWANELFDPASPDTYAEVV